MDRSECPMCGAPCTSEYISQARRIPHRKFTYTPPPPAEQASGELIARLREARTDFDCTVMPDVAEPIGVDCGLLREAEEMLSALSQRPVVDEAMVERACEAYWNDAGGDGPHPNPWPEGAEPLTEDVRKGMRVALAAALAGQQPTTGEGND